ncbi:unnamed protein product [Chondrus crispus]|uniref:Uncharacterized protein n=1 Tax=Chondrus crispus TaxID=2769 RepID=R7Q4N1_CHOCR|nr:unnamed protein product [Chondrus crispus]CDF32420.1 unnamed protein product [Chondrus crispus]|eukprot:XP_005712085.1 unnamed protein product [Chondrus crispus]
MTRRASAAAAAAAAVSAVAADLTRITAPAIPLPVMPHTSALSESHRSPSPMDSVTSPTTSEVSGDASDLSSSTSSVDDHRSASCPQIKAHISTATNSCHSTVRSEYQKEQPSMEPALIVAQTSASSMHVEAVTPELSRPTRPDSGFEKQMSQFLSAPLHTCNSKSPFSTAEASRCASNTAKSKNRNVAAQKRRTPGLPVVKTAYTKKERHSIVAKCTEPRPGQTRYWTEEEHERFLEAVAEYGEKAYVAISNYVETRTPKQVRTHAQKFQMKMARLAKQSIEAGEPIQMPAGMNPVVQVPTADGKSTLVPLAADGQANHVLAKLGNVMSGHVPVMMAPPPRRGEGKKRTGRKCGNGSKKEKKAGVSRDALVKMSSCVSEEMSDENASGQTDPYMEYIGGASDPKVEMELEHSFAAKLQTLNGGGHVVEGGREGEFLMSDEGSNDSRRVDKDDDDLEDLDKLDDGEFALAAFTNTEDNWLLPDVLA